MGGTRIFKIKGFFLKNETTDPVYSKTKLDKSLSKYDFQSADIVLPIGCDSNFYILPIKPYKIIFDVEDQSKEKEYNASQIENTGSGNEAFVLKILKKPSEGEILEFISKKNSETKYPIGKKATKALLKILYNDEVIYGKILIKEFVQ